jgi:hypothetical protein
MTTFEIVLLIAIAVIGLCVLICFAAYQINTQLGDTKPLGRRTPKATNAFITDEYFKATGKILRETSRHRHGGNVRRY